MIRTLVVFALLYLAVDLATATLPKCRQDSDCEASECCRHSMFGRKKRFIFDDIFEHGHCHPLGQVNQTCEPNMNAMNDHKHRFGCPCEDGLDCRGEHEYHHESHHHYINPRCVVATTGSPSQAPTTEAATTQEATTQEATTQEATTQEATTGAPETTAAPAPESTTT